jgi:hypothetical protein
MSTNASEISAESRSRQRFLFVNSKLADCFDAGAGTGSDWGTKGVADMEAADQQLYFLIQKNRK